MTRPARQSMLFAGSIPAVFLARVAAPATAYEAVQVADGGTISGKVVYQGEVSTRKIISRSRRRPRRLT